MIRGTEGAFSLRSQRCFFGSTFAADYNAIAERNSPTECRRVLFLIRVDPWESAEEKLPFSANSAISAVDFFGRAFAAEHNAIAERNSPTECRRVLFLIRVDPCESSAKKLPFSANSAISAIDFFGRTFAAEHNAIA